MIKRKQLILSVVLLFCLAAVAAAALWQESINTTPETAIQILDSQLEFSEICTRNETIIADNDGRYRDYVEICNNGEDFNLQGCYLTNGKERSAPFGDEVLRGGEYRICFLGDDLTGFALRASGGDCLQLLDPSGHILIQTTTASLQADQVMLASSRTHHVSDDASPGFSNTPEGMQAFREGTETDTPRLAISEILADNTSAMASQFGEYCDMIELVNTTEEPLDLRDFCLSDNRENRFRYRFPGGIVPPGGYVVICCDGENVVEEDGTIHSNFGLRYADTLCVTDRDGSYMAVPVTCPGEDLSMARMEDGSFAPWPVSLGWPNDETGAAQFLQSRTDPDPKLVISEVLLSSAGIPYEGRFCDVAELYNRSREVVSTAGWYLSDGGDPMAYALPARDLQPGERMVIVCDGPTTGFALAQGEVLRLLTPEGLWASQVQCEAVSGSMICLQAGQEAVYGTDAVTLGYSNDQTGRAQYLSDTQQGLLLWEAMSANRTYLKGAYGATGDWLELYNAGAEEVRLSDYTLSDNSNALDRYGLPDKALQPGQFCVLFLSEEPEDLNPAYAVVPMNLSAGGETLYLSRDGMAVDYMFLPALEPGRSYGRSNETREFSVLAAPTPGNTNDTGMGLSARPEADVPQGVYQQDSLSVTLSAPGKIYYTTNSTAPSTRSTLYTGPITLTQTTVIRAICCEDGKEPSSVVNLTYLINEADQLPALCIVTEPHGLFDPTYGMYMEGPNAEAEAPHIGANYWLDMEKSATVSLFEKDGTGFSQPCGLRIFGGYSRALYMKSFSLHFRETYGASRLRYPLFGEAGLDSYETFILRAMGQDLYGARMRDVLATSLISEQTNVAVQKYRPVCVYINERFWGVYFIREKANVNYVAGNYNADPEDVILADGNGTTSAEYQALMQYVRTHDLSQQEAYDYVCSQIDVQNYMDYIIGEIWVGNNDNGNIKFFRTPEMKWSWIMYDTDWGFSIPSNNTVQEHLAPFGTGSGDRFSTALINGLLENDQFREAFLRRFAWQINNIWSEDRVLSRVEELESILAHDLVKDYERWFRDYEDWVREVEDVRQFARTRSSYVVQHLQEYFDLSRDQMIEYGFPV